jgi:hypothetical protein
MLLMRGRQTSDGRVESVKVDEDICDGLWVCGLLAVVVWETAHIWSRDEKNVDGGEMPMLDRSRHA